MGIIKLFLGMAVRSKKKIIPKETENSREIKYLETLIEYSLRAVDGKFEKVDSAFKEQAKRLQDKIDKIKENQ
jgi:hypothetical protein